MIKLNEKIKVAIYAQHCTRAGKWAVGREDEKSDDLIIYEGTRDELLREAGDIRRANRRENNSNGAYMRRVARSIVEAIR